MNRVYSEVVPINSRHADIVICRDDFERAVMYQASQYLDCQNQKEFQNKLSNVHFYTNVAAYSEALLHEGQWEAYAFLQQPFYAKHVRGMMTCDDDLNVAHILVDLPSIIRNSRSAGIGSNRKDYVTAIVADRILQHEIHHLIRKFNPDTQFVDKVEDQLTRITNPVLTLCVAAILSKVEFLAPEIKFLLGSCFLSYIFSHLHDRVWYSFFSSAENAARNAEDRFTRFSSVFDVQIIDPYDPEEYE